MRNPVAWIMLLALVLAGFSITGSAQPNVANCEVSLFTDDANPGTDEFEPEETRTYTFTAQNTGDLEAQAEVFISDPPVGWSWPTRMPTISLDSQEESSVEVDVTFLGEVQQDASFSMELEEVQCDAPLGAGSVSGTTNGAQSHSFTHAPMEGAEEDALPWPWIVFGVIVAGAVVGVPVAYQRRGARIDATVEDSEKDVIAGRGTSFPVTLKNKSNDPVPVKLEVVDVQEGWSALTTLPDLELAGKETRTVYMMVRAPPEAKPGDLCVAKLAVKPEGGPSTTVKTLTRVDEGSPEGDERPPEGDEEDEEPEEN